MNYQDNDSLELIPALDVHNGQTVRITNGEADDTMYAAPVEVALEFERQGAQILHLVDLNKAYGTGNNAELLKKVIEQLSIPVQVSGGIEIVSDVQQALEMGAERVNISSGALRNRQECREIAQNFGSNVSLSLDVNPETLLITPRGSKEDVGLSLDEALSFLHDIGVTRYVITDVTRDGNLSGPNFELLEYCLIHSDYRAIASGGVASLADLYRLAKMVPKGLSGVILGKALYEEKFTLAQAQEEVAS